MALTQKIIWYQKNDCRSLSTKETQNINGSCQMISTEFSESSSKWKFFKCVAWRKLFINPKNIIGKTVSLDDIQIENHYTLVGISCFADVSPLNLLVKGQEEDIISISRIHDDRKSFI